jgi:natural product biosynthesis luciferase-like monooxygenase protein
MPIMSSIHPMTSPSTLIDALQRQAAQQPDKIAFAFLHDGEEERGALTFGQLDRAARSIGLYLQHYSKPGDRALLLYPTGLEYVAAFFGCLYAGVIAVPAYPPKASGKLERIISIVDDSDAAVVLTVPEVGKRLASDFLNLPRLKSLPVLNTEVIPAEIEAAVDQWQGPEILPETLAFLQYTSGSTADPKGVMVSHGNLIHNIGLMQERFGLDQNTVGVSWLPIYHDMGLISQILTPVYVGGHCVLMSPVAFIQRPACWLQAISKYRGTFSAAPNFAYDLCIRKVPEEKKRELDLSSLKALLNGAEPVRAISLKQFEEAFAVSGFRPEVMRPSYGLAEGTLLATTSEIFTPPVVRSFTAESLELGLAVEDLSSEPESRTLVSCGLGCQDQKTVIVDPNTLVSCPDEQVGEVWLASASVAQGYWNKTEQTRQTFRGFIAGTGEGPFLRTGDLGFVHHGELFITGRAKDLIIINGRNHYPQDIELTVEQSHPALAPGSGAAFSIEVDNEERLVVVQEVQRTHLRKLDVNEVVENVRQAVAEQHELDLYAVELLKPAQLPRTTSGKLQRSLTRKKFLARKFDTVKPKQELSGPAVSVLASASAANSRNYMQFSLFYFSANEAEFHQDKYRLFLEGARFADQHGFKAVWVPERHFHAFGGIYPNPSVLGAALAMTTSQIRIRSGSVVLPLHDPIRVAEEWSVVDNLSRGRVDLAFARGWNPNDFVLAPANFADSRNALYKGMEAVRKLWRGDTISVPNGLSKETSIRIYPLPHQRDLNIWLTCSGGLERFVEAGEGGWNILTALLFQSVEELEQKLTAYREARARAGHPGSGHVTLMLHTFLGTDAAQVKNIVRGPFIEYLKTSVDLWRHGFKDLNDLNPEEREQVLNYAFERYYHLTALFGTPETCFQTVQRLRKVGVDEIACLIDFGIETELALQGLKILNTLKEMCLPAGNTVAIPCIPVAAVAEEKVAKQAAVSATCATLPCTRIQNTASPVAEVPSAGWNENTPENQLLLRHLKEFMARQVALMLGTSESTVSYTRNFLGLGLNSLKVVEIIGSIQDQFNVKISPSLVFEFPSIEQLALALAQRHRSNLLPNLPKKPVVSSAAGNSTESLVLREAGELRAGSKSVGNGDIAIIGFSGRFPGAPDSASYWELLKNGRDAVTEVPEDHWNWRPYFDSNPDAEKKTYSRWGGFLKNLDLFDAPFFNISPREAKLMDPQQRIFLETAYETFEHAGYSPESLSQQQVGVFVGSSYAEYYPRIQSALKQADHAAGVGNQNAIIANRVSFFLNLHGPSFLVDTLCSSSLVAVHLAGQSLKNGECAVALAGGINLLLLPEHFIIMSRMKAHSPDGRCKTFDHRADGICFGEGCGAVLLKPLARAIEDNDTIYAVIKGSASNHGGQANGLLAPNPEGQAQVIRKALDAAEISADTVSYIEAHGTGTALGDPIEIEGLTKAFRHDTNRTQFCSIGSVKTNIGHLEAAAGIAGIIKVVLAMQHRQLPPSLHFEKPNPYIPFEQSPFKVQAELSDWKSDGIRRAGISGFGVGGSNVHIILEESPARTVPEHATERPRHLLALSAKTGTALRALAGRYVSFLKSNSDINLPDLCFSANAGRSHFTHRLAVGAEDVSQLKCNLEAFLDRKSDTAVFQGQCREDKRPGIAFLFTGQGSQYSGMGGRLFESEPLFRSAVERCDAILKSRIGRGFLPGLFTEPSTQLITDPVMAQTALFALEYSLAEVWRSWGIVPNAVMGHSLGEYVAAQQAGVFSLDDGLWLVAERARLMQEKALPGGRMAAVFASEAAVAQNISQHAGYVSIAAVNGPKNVVISGHAAHVNGIVDELRGKDIVAEFLNVTHAFHSPLLDPVLQSFEDAAAKIACRDPQLPLISNVSGQGFEPGVVPDAAYWRRHMRQPVKFAAGINHLAEQGMEVFVEVGPSAVLTGMARHCVSSSKLTFIPSLKNSADDWEFLLGSLARLYVTGARVDWTGFDRSYTRRRIALPLYPFERQRYWLEAGASDEPVSQPLSHQNGGEVLVSSEVSMITSNNTATVAAAGSVSRLETITTSLRQSVARFLEMDEGRVDIYKSFLEMGSDSLVLIAAIQEIQKAFGIKLTVRQLFAELTNIHLLATYLDANMPADAAFLENNRNAAKPLENVAAPIQPQTVSSPALNTVISDEKAEVFERIIAQQLASMNQLMQQQLLTAAGFQSAGPSRTVPAAAQARVQAPPFIARTASSGLVVPAPDATGGTSRPWLPYQPLNPGTMDDLSPAQQKYLRNFMAEYSARTRKSKEATQKYRRHHADLRAAMSFRLCTKEIRYPIIGVRTEGALLWDPDGNEYADFTMGYGVNLFGHNPPFVMNALEEQLKKGIHVGPQSELAGEVASLICELTGMERVTFCNSGTEAVMAALRVARASTGRKKIALFAGAYHGTSDGVLVSTELVNGQHRVIPMAPGIMPGSVEDIVVLNYGSLRSLELLKANIHEFAAVLVEPVQSRKPDLQPEEFLHELRKLTEEAGVVLILDEVITGFRVDVRGAQGWFGVEADLATYGKVIGGGLPIGVLAGKAAFMDAIDGGVWSFGDDSMPSATTTFYSGTFCKHPLAMAAARAVLLELKQRGPQLISSLNARTKELALRLNQCFRELHAPIEAVRFGSLFRLGGGLQVMSADALDLLYYHLIHNGIYVWEGRNWFLSTVHTQQQVDSLVDIMRRIVLQLQDTGFIPRPASEPFSGSYHSVEAVANGSRSCVLVPVASSASRTLPVTETQKDLCLLSLGNETASLSYNQSAVLRLQGPLSSVALKNALDRVSERHESLRTIFSAGGEHRTILPQSKPMLVEIDFSGLASGAQEIKISEWLEKEAQHPFDIPNETLWRVAVLKLNELTHVLVLTIHHLIADGWSIGVLLHEIGSFYSAQVENRPATLPASLQLEDYTEILEKELQKPEAAVAESFWLSELNGSSPVELPLDYPRSLTRYGSRFQKTLDPALMARIAGVSSRLNSTVFMTFLATYQLFLAQLTGQDDLVAVFPVAGHSQLKNAYLVGDCSNLVTIRGRLKPEMTFAECVAGVKNALLNCNDHLLYPFARVMRKLVPQRDPVRWPFFNIDKPFNSVKFSGLEIEDLPFPIRYANFDFGLNITMFTSKIEIAFDYKTALFNAETIRKWAASFEDLLQKVADDPQITLAGLPRERQSSLKGTIEMPGRGESLYVPPRTPVEEQLAQIWAEVLGQPQISIFADFFEVGGHSLLATQIVSRVKATLGLDLRIDDLFEQPSVAGVAALLESRRRPREQDEPIPVVPRNRPLPLSFSQRRLWVIDRLEPGNTAYNGVGAVRLRGPLDVSAFQQAFDETMRRHESLRSAFRVVDDQPVQEVLEPKPVQIQQVLLQGLPEQQRSLEILRRSQEAARQPFDLAAGYLLRIQLLTFDEYDHAFIVVVHHIVSDGWSLGVLLEDFGVLYKNFSILQPSSLPALRVQFADYAVWQRSRLQGKNLQRHTEYWLKQLEGVPPFLNLPTDQPRLAVPSFRGAHEPFSLSPQLSHELKQFSRREGVTDFMTLLAVFSILLGRCAGQDDFVIGTDIANRNRMETEKLIGLFVNLLPLRMTMAGDPSFHDYLRSIRKITLDAYAHQDMPFDELLRKLKPQRKLTTTPLVQVLFVLQNAPLPVPEIEGLKLEIVPVLTETAEFELILAVEECNGVFAGTLGYSTDLFDRSRIQSMISQLQHLLEQILRNPGQRLSSFNVFSDREKLASLANRASNLQLGEKDLATLLIQLGAS